MILSERQNLESWLIILPRRLKNLAWAYPLGAGYFQLFNSSGNPAGILSWAQVELLVEHNKGELESPFELSPEDEKWLESIH